MTRRSGFTIMELLLVVAIVALMITMLLPAFSRAHELARQMAEQNVAESLEEAAEQAEDLDLDSRIAALAGRMHMGAVAEGNFLTQRVGVLQIEGHEFRVEADTRGELIVDRVAVRIDSQIVYERALEFLDGGDTQMGEIGFYRGMGEWEHMLDEAERLVGENTRLAREAKFKADLEKRYGPLPGFGDVE